MTAFVLRTSITRGHNFYGWGTFCVTLAAGPLLNHIEEVGSVCRLPEKALPDGALCYKKLSMTLILFNKPYQVMTQFSPHPARKTLADYLDIPGIYPAGRLDADSEGLLLLTDDGALQHTISHPARKQPKTYIVQVEGEADSAAIKRLEGPLDLGDFVTLPCQVRQIQAPDWLWPRDPPIRQRLNSPTSWLAITLSEGKNRQVRRMTAAVGLPTLRLVRTSVGPFSLETHPLWPGDWREVSPAELK
jgi:23S rRNA pseudouridine2457 synthase